MSNPKISIILACAKGQEESQQVVDDLLSRIQGCDIEIVIATPGYSIERAVNVHDQMEGNARAMALCYSRCSGEYVAWWSDEAIPEPDAFQKMVEFLQSKEHNFIGEFHVDDVGHPRIPQGVYLECSIFGNQYARFGMASKKTLEDIGGFFDYNFHAHWADPDLGLRCWLADGKVGSCVDALIHVAHVHDDLHQNNQKYFDTDLKYFLSKWKKEYPTASVNWLDFNTSKEWPL